MTPDFASFSRLEVIIVSPSLVSFLCFHHDILSFPTRRSSDLDDQRRDVADDAFVMLRREFDAGPVAALHQKLVPHRARSEEHTSELQSPCNLVCRLLLEKKKKKDMRMYKEIR